MNIHYDLQTGTHIDLAAGIAPGHFVFPGCRSHSCGYFRGIRAVVSESFAGNPDVSGTYTGICGTLVALLFPRSTSYSRLYAFCIAVASFFHRRLGAKTVLVDLFWYIVCTFRAIKPAWHSVYHGHSVRFPLIFLLSLKLFFHGLMAVLRPWGSFASTIRPEVCHA